MNFPGAGTPSGHHPDETPARLEEAERVGDVRDVLAARERRIHHNPVIAVTLGGSTSRKSRTEVAFALGTRLVRTVARL
ncbi:hypothetical protein GCM10020220_019280 [Nonomuraea rubra]